MRITSDPRLIHSFPSTLPSMLLLCFNPGSPFLFSILSLSRSLTLSDLQRWSVRSVVQRNKVRNTRATTAAKQSQNNVVYKFLSLRIPNHSVCDTHTQTHTLNGHVGTARLKMGNPVALSPSAHPVLSSGLTAYLCVCVRVCFS